jgi:hypothetical protein
VAAGSLLPVNEATPSPTAEEAVRRFLQFLSDPTIARDDALVAELQRNLDMATDVIDRLKLIQAVKDAEAADGSNIRAAFVQHAKAWAATNRISVAAFRELGVNDIALAEAGFDLGFGRGRQASKGAKGTAGSSVPAKPRAASVSSEDIRNWMLAQEAPFTLAMVMHSAGGSLGTVNKAVEDLISAGKARNLGKDPKHSGRGRAPFVYERIPD